VAAVLYLLPRNSFSHLAKTRCSIIKGGCSTVPVAKEWLLTLGTDKVLHMPIIKGGCSTIPVAKEWLLTLGTDKVLHMPIIKCGCSIVPVAKEWLLTLGTDKVLHMPVLSQSCYHTLFNRPSRKIYKYQI
jgi:uncharacterized protein YaiE (UPF0345 family)